MTETITNSIDEQPDTRLLFDDWTDPIETGVRERVRGFIEAMIEEELADLLGRSRYARCDDGKAAVGHRHGHRSRRLTGTFGTVEIAVPRARLNDGGGRSREWRSQSLRAYQRRTQAADALIAGTYLAGTNSRRVRRALAAVFDGAIGKDVVSRVWRKVKTDWEAWNTRSLADEDIVRLILDGTVVRVKVDKKATSISTLVALGVRRDGQKVLLSLKNMGGESEAAWRAFLEDTTARGLKTPEFLIIARLAWKRLWQPYGPRSRFSAARSISTATSWPMRPSRDMIYADTAGEIEAKRKAFLRKWRLKCQAVATSLAEAGDRLFSFTSLPKSQWRSARTTNAIERLHEEFKRRIKTQTVLPAAETAPMLFWALLASGQITMRKVDGWQTLSQPLEPIPIDLAA